MSDWMFDDGSAGALLNQDYTPPVPPVWDEPEPQGAPSQDPLFGDDPPVDEVDEVVVTGYSGGGNDYGGGGGGGAGGGNWPTDTTWLDPEAPDNDLPCTPPPDGPTPTGVDMDELRREAKEIGRKLDELTRSDGNEWGSLIYRNADGTLGISGPHTIGSPDNIGYPSDAIPDGATLVAEVHSHPYRRGEPQGRLSVDDEAGRDVISENFDADPNFMTYVWDERNDELHEFDKDDHALRTGTRIGDCYG